MPVLLLLIVIFLALMIAIWLFFSLVGLVFTLFIAGLIGWLADQIVPGRIPYGFIGAIVAGLLGSLIGGLLLHNFGPKIGHIAIIPAFVGTLIVAFAAQFIFKEDGTRRL
jgi:uncharacterized membrane protein YeaQ/YmgE (transglycosylase-associated protein family)